MLFQDLGINFLGLLWCTLHLLWAVSFKTSFSTTLIGQFKNKFQTISWNVAGIFSWSFQFGLGSCLGQVVQNMIQKNLSKSLAKKTLPDSQSAGAKFYKESRFQKSSQKRRICFKTPHSTIPNKKPKNKTKNPSLSLSLSLNKKSKKKTKQKKQKKTKQKTKQKQNKKQKKQTPKP